MSMALLIREAREAVRRLRRSPRFLVVAVLTMGAAISPSLLFTLVGRAVIPPLPFEEPHRVVRVWSRHDGWPGATSYPLLNFLRTNTRLMDVAIQTAGELHLELADSSVRLMGEAVTPGYFGVFRLRPLVGRAFRDTDNLTPFAHEVVILSERVWRARFGASADVVGTRIRLSGDGYEVIGVVPDINFMYRGHVRDVDVFLPAMMASRLKSGREWHDTARALESPTAGIWVGEARLRDGVSLSQARDEAKALGLRAAELWPGKTRTVPFDLVLTSEDALDPKLLRAVALLRAAGLLVLTLGAINLGTLLIARGARRSQALVVHTLLGAPRSILVAGVAFEALIICVLGSIAAIALTSGALRLLGFLEPSILTAPFGVTFDPSGWSTDGGLVARAFGLAFVTAIGCGGVTAFRMTSVARLIPSQGSGVLSGGLRALRFRRPAGALIALEVALAIAITTPALLMARSLGHLVRADLGFVAASVVTVPLSLPAHAYPGEAVGRFIDRATAEIGRRTAGSASWVSCLPIDCRAFYSQGAKRLGADAPAAPAVAMSTAPGAFEVLKLPLITGRDFDERDRAGGPAAVILSRTAAAALTATLGSRIEFAGVTAEVVGIVGDVQYGDFANEMLPVVYRPATQSSVSSGVLIVRSDHPTRDVGHIVGESMRAIDASLSTDTATLLASHVDASMARFRGASWLLGAASALSLWLAAIGIYGMVSMLMSRAIPEIGLRLALGATPRGILGMVGGHAARLAAGGLLVGGALGAWSARFLAPYLFGISSLDVPTFALGSLLALTLATGSVLFPARRASLVDPTVVLRNDG